MQVEAELTELAIEERQEYLKSLGVGESGLGNLIRATYELLGLRTYFTSGEKVRENLEKFLESITVYNILVYEANIDSSNNLRKLNHWIEVITICVGVVLDSYMCQIATCARHGTRVQCEMSVLHRLC